MQYNLFKYLVFICTICICISLVAGNKKVLMYSHLAKAGGTEIIDKLLKAFHHVPLFFQTENMADFLKADKSSVSPIELSNIIDQNNTNNSWLVLQCFVGLDAVDTSNFDKIFIIGSIREPCSYHLSYWAYQSSFNHTDRPGLHYGKDEHYSSKADVERFRLYIADTGSKGIDPTLKKLGRRDMFSGGLLTRRVLTTYTTKDHKFSTDDVDCWVRTEKLNDDLNICFQRFMAQGGVVPYYDNFNKTITAQKDHKNPSDHQHCSYYFDHSTARLIHESEAFIYKTFDMVGCCVPDYPNPTAV